jgi:D-ribulokinase
MLGAVSAGAYGSIADAMASMSAIGRLSDSTASGVADFHRSKRGVHRLMRQFEREGRVAMRGDAIGR